MPTYSPARFNNRDLTLLKPVKSPDLIARTVLTNEPWEYVDLYLVRNNHPIARFYWQQAKEFHTVASGLRLQSAPLLLYYAFMNAAKALLSAKGIAFNEHHGVKKWEPTPAATLDNLQVGVKIKTDGILPSLSRYYGESEPAAEHTLAEILFNLPFIHRTYCLTNEPLEEMFIPISNQSLVVEDGTNNVFVMGKLPSGFPGPRYCQHLPASFLALTGHYQGHVLSQRSVAISSAANPTAADLQAIQQFVENLRNDVYYINGLSTLWYLKANSTARARLRRQTTTLTLAAMHRLSEECRYQPMNLAKCLEGDSNWLVSEFIRMSAEQYIDEIASEITGKQFLKPNVRPAA